MGKRHAAAAAGIARAQADEQLREAEARRSSAERERQLLTSYLGSADQVAGTGRFANATPEVLKYTQRYSVDQSALAEILASGSQVKRQEDPFQGADNRVRGGLSLSDYGQGFANRANDLLAQAEAAARAGDLATAEQLFVQAQAVIGGVSQVAQGAYNLGGGEESAAAVRASSAEGRIVGRQLLAAQGLQDPNSAESTGLRGRLLDPSLAIIGTTTDQAIGEIDESEREAQRVIDENTRNAERAIAAERSQIDGEIRQRGGGGGVGVNARAQLALQSRAGSEAARARAEVYSNAAAQQAAIASDAGLQRAQVYTMQGAQRAQLTAQVSLYMNEFAKRMAEDSVRLAQEWVNGTANVRDEFQIALDRFSIIGIEMANQRALIAQQIAEQRRAESKGASDFTKGGLLGAASSVFSKVLPEIIQTKDDTDKTDASGQMGQQGAAGQVLGLVGTGVGSAFGGPVGGAVGGAIGSLLGSFFQ